MATKKEVELENKVNQLEETLKNLMNTIQNNNSNKTENIKPETIEYEDDEDIPFNKSVKVMSLIDNKLTVSTEGDGKGIKYDFVKFGQVRGILYEQLISIVNNNESFANEGIFYIMNPKVVKVLGLEEQYKKILDKKTIENVLDLGEDEIVKFFKGTTKSIQETIVSILKNKIINQEYVDYNKVNIISKLYRHDINELARYQEELYTSNHS